MKINDFFKTDHFLYRQWDRNIDDLLLKKVLSRIPFSCEKTSVCVMPNLVEKLGVKNRDNCLILIIHKKVLLTCYWHPIQELFFSNSLYNPLIIA